MWYAIVIVLALIVMAILTVELASFWIMIDKTGQPGWGWFIPIYQLVIWLRITGKPMWWLAFFLVPCLSFITAPVIALLLWKELAARFGKGIIFQLGMVLFPWLCVPILAFSSAEYTPPQAA